jgi:cytochrome c553
MRKLIFMTIIVLTAVAALVAFATEAPEAPEAQKVPEKITIDACADTKAAVEFPHKAHFELTTCVDCHHTSEGLTAETAADMTVETCASCHVEPEKAETPICSQKSTKKNPYHIKCLGCHKADKKENAETKAPTKCTACHPKPAEAAE